MASGRVGLSLPRQVTCINRRGDHYDPHERISRIGASDWRLREVDAIAQVKRDPSSFFVPTGGATVYLVLRTHGGREYLATEADGYAPNNLLALPECEGGALG